MYHYLLLQGRIFYLFGKYVTKALILPLLSINLTIWSELSDFIVAANAMKDGEWFLGIMIGITPFFAPILNTILISRSSTLRRHCKRMNVVQNEWFPFLQIKGHLKNRYKLLGPNKELYTIEKQLLTAHNSKKRKCLIQQKALVQSEMIWPLRRISCYKYFEALESILETCLQYFLLFRKTKEIKNIVPFLKNDYLTNGLSGSLICSLFSSEFSFIYFTLNKWMAEPFIDQTQTLLPSLNVGILTIFKLSLIGIVLQFSRMAVVIVCMNGFAFIAIYYLLHRIMNHFWFPNSRHLAITGTFFSMKGMYPLEDTNTNRTFYRSLLYAFLEIAILWILSFISGFFGHLIKPEIVESPSILVLFSIFLLANPIGVYLQLHTLRKNNVFAACACGDVDMLREMMSRPSININAVDQYHRTGFIIGCQYGQTEVVNFFLKCKKRDDIDFNKQANSGLTGFHIACIRGHYKVVSLIVQHASELGINLFQKDCEGQTGFEMWPEIFIETDSEIQLKKC